MVDDIEPVALAEVGRLLDGFGLWRVELGDELRNSSMCTGAVNGLRATLYCTRYTREPYRSAELRATAGTSSLLLAPTTKHSGLPCTMYVCVGIH